MSKYPPLLCILALTFHFSYSQQWQVYTTANSGLQNNYLGSAGIFEQASYITTDHENAIWVLAGEDPVTKLCRFNPATNQWLTFDITDAPFSASGAIKFTTIYATKNRKVWISTESSGFNATTYEYDGTQWTTMTSIIAAWDFEEDHAGNTWNIGYDQNSKMTLLQHTPQGPVNHTMSINGYPAPGSNLAFFDIDFDTSDNLWATVWQLNNPSRCMLVKYKEGFSPVIYYVGTKFISALEIQEDNDIWIGTISVGTTFSPFTPAAGIGRFKANNFEFFSTVNSPIPNDTILSIRTSPSDRLWIGTMNGLARFDEANNDWKVFKPNNSPLLSGKITGIRLDTLGNKWITTLDGLAKFNEITPAFNHTNACFRTVAFKDLSTSMDGNIVAHHWDFGGVGTSNGADPSFTFPAPGDYDVRLWMKDVKGNRNIITQKVTVTDNSPDLVLATSADACATSAVLTANITDAAHYIWTTPTEILTGGISHTARIPGRYILVAQMAGGCEKKDTIDVALNAATAGSFTIAGTSITGCPQTYSKTEALLFTNTTKGGTGFTWSFGNGETSSLADPSYTFQQDGEYTIVLNGADGHGCAITANKTINVQTTLALGPDKNTCEPTVTLDAGITDVDSYTWHAPTGTVNGTGETTLTASASGDYTLTILKGGCHQTDAINITVTDQGQIGFIITAAGKIIDDGAIILNDMDINFVKTGNNHNFIWEFGDNTSSGQEAPVHQFKKAGTYTIILKGNNDRSCSLQAEKTIEVRDLMITTAISPNGDGKNDRLFVEPFLFEASLKVIDRKGKTVYEAHPYNDDFTGQNLEQGVYFYELSLKEINKQYKGYVHIIK